MQELLDQIQNLKEAIAELYKQKAELEAMVRMRMIAEELTDITNGTVRAKVVNTIKILNEEELAKVVEHKVVTSYKFDGRMLTKLYKAGEHRDLLMQVPSIEFSKDERKQ